MEKGIEKVLGTVVLAENARETVPDAFPVHVFRPLSPDEDARRVARSSTTDWKNHDGFRQLQPRFKRAL